MKTLILILFFVLSSLLFSTVINVPADQPTIQQGIDIATTGDTVLVADGVYTGELNRNLSWNGNEKHITVKSENGPENCWINCQQSGRAFSFIETYQDSTDIIEGFTLYEGYVLAAWEFHGGGAICCDDASPKILNNVITNNHVDESHGGAIFLYNSNSQVIGNVIKNNFATFSGFPGSICGGGIFTYSSSSLIKDNIIRNNYVATTDLETSAIGGGICAYFSDAIIINNLIMGNDAYGGGLQSLGGGIFLDPVSPFSKVTNNVIFDNNADRGSGINCNWAELRNNIIVDNSQEGVRSHWPTHTSIIMFNNVWGNPINFVNCTPGVGNTSWGFNLNGTACDSCYNISEDPVFTSYLEDDFFLSQIEAGQNVQSPCVDAGSGVPADFGLENYTTRTDLICDEGIVDMGFHYPGIILQDVEEIFVYSTFNYKHTNYPNPFNPSTTISFSLQNNSNVELSIYNIKGQKVKTFPNQQINKSSNQQIIWNGTDDNNLPVGSGVYFYKLQTPSKSYIRKCILLK